MAKSLVMMFQRDSIVLGWEVSISLLEEKVLRVRQHIVEGCYIAKSYWIPRASQKAGMAVIFGDKDYSRSEKNGP